MFWDDWTDYCMNFMIIGVTLFVVLLMIAVPFIVIEYKKLDEKCKVQYEQSVKENKNLIDYECYKHLQPQSSSTDMPMPIIIPMM